MKKRLIGPVILLAAALGTAACGASTTSSPDARPAAAVQQAGLDVSVLRGADNDVEPAATPEALVKSNRHHAIVAGTVDGIEQGRETFDSEADPYALMNVVLRVKVTDKLKGADRVKDGFVYVELWQGGRYNDATGTPVNSLDKWRQSIPAGTPVMLFLREDDGKAKSRNAGKGLPQGAKLMIPDVLGIVFEDGGKLLGGIEELEGQWTEIKSMSQLRERVRNAVG
ncbi:hypothetical protein SAMN05192558_10927 [Actinokineospora alba]|uniref:Lipoprotein n=1 Tax=Actinokineospora alba TaxID=504798 RepID=A0A1H0SPD3_9PSEU|nr:hypothetical protein [Actinokineospora alba]TDP66605.1 hypothetical protein C8E96_2117 [Actinokineospora alba]SDJ38760.1 hypothetical protein SAMN05421871_114119 [Actinokineospora alba]SDP43587.1 hypothetical protein SAMN05192558_10927 [Actinokineospora alba]